MKFIYVPRTEAFIKTESAAKRETSIPSPEELRDAWGKNYQLFTLDFMGKFDLTDGDQVYVIAGHGKPGSGVVYWGEEKNEDNWLPAETVAKLTAAKFPTCYRAQTGKADIATKPSKKRVPGISIKVYSCHSGEGGFDSFASRFARAFEQTFRPTGDTFEITIFGYRGKISVKPQTLNKGNVDNSKYTIDNVRSQLRDLFSKGKISKEEAESVPEDYTGPKESVAAGETHRWSKIHKWLYQSRASEARDKVAWLKLGV